MDVHVLVKSYRVLPKACMVMWCCANTEQSAARDREGANVHVSAENLPSPQIDVVVPG